MSSARSASVGSNPSVALSSGPQSGRTITRYEWNFGDNVPAEGARIEHVFTRAGGITVTLTVTDSNGATDTETKTITVAP